MDAVSSLVGLGEFTIALVILSAIGLFLCAGGMWAFGYFFPSVALTVHHEWTTGQMPLAKVVKAVKTHQKSQQLALASAPTDTTAELLRDIVREEIKSMSMALPNNSSKS